MNLFNTNGIYVIADLSLCVACPALHEQLQTVSHSPLNGSINRAAPSWDVGLLNEYTRTLDSLAQYENLLAVNIGNEVVSGPTSSQAAPFVKAAARDIKAYIASRNYGLLVAYAAVDGDSWRDDLAEYLNCGDESVQIDLYGLNNYRCALVIPQSCRRLMLRPAQGAATRPTRHPATPLSSPPSSTSSTFPLTSPSSAATANRLEFGPKSPRSSPSP